MGKIGKPENAPGYAFVSHERKKWENEKRRYLNTSWFINGLDMWVNHYERMSLLIENKYKHVWNDKKHKYSKVLMTPEELRISRRYSLNNNGLLDIEYSELFRSHNWRGINIELFKEILFMRLNATIDRLYDIEKGKEKENLEQSIMSCNDINITKHKKRVRFAM